MSVANWRASAIWQANRAKTAEARVREWAVCRLLAQHKDSAEWSLEIAQDDRTRMRRAWITLEVINAYDNNKAVSIRKTYGHRRVADAGMLWRRKEFEVS